MSRHSDEVLYLNSAVRKIKKYGTHIMKVSGHRSYSSLKSYFNFVCDQEKETTL